MTSGELLVLGKALIWFGIPIAFALWELWGLSRARRARAEAPREVEPQGPTKVSR